MICGRHAGQLCDASDLLTHSEAFLQEVRYHGIHMSYVMPGAVRTGFAGIRAHRTQAAQVGSRG
jgi:short-subunit dehydrogenase